MRTSLELDIALFFLGRRLRKLSMCND